MLPWTSVLAVACALGGLLASAEAWDTSGAEKRPSLVPPGAYCGPCDIRACPTIQAESCQGLVLKDECNCCPVCQVSLTSDSPVEDLNFTASKNETGCASVTCPRMQICVHNIQGLPLCRCPSVYHCRQFKRKPLCGRDGHTYKNRCYLQMTECSQGKKIRVAYVDKCRGEDEVGLDKEQRKKNKEERKKNRKQKKKQRRKERRKIGLALDDIEDPPKSEITPPTLPPLDPKESTDNSLTKLTAKERRKQRRKERQKRRKLKRREKKRRQRRRSRRSCVHEPQ